MSVKETVLDMLRTAKKNDEYISGEALAQKCNVTRASVWKAVKTLQDEGAVIEAVSNNGYKLIAENFFNQNTIESALKKITDSDNKSKNIKIIFHDVIDSTNTEAKRLLLNGNSNELNKTVVVAAEQTAGRGRLGRSFYSPSQTGIYFSIIYAPENNFHPTEITAQAAVGISRAIKNIYNVETQIKWVNDIYIGTKKISGILTEGTTNLETGIIEAAVIGIGINIAENKNKPEEIKDKAGAICSITGQTDFFRSELTASAIVEVLKIIDGSTQYKKDAMEEYKRRSNLIGKTITVTPVINQEEGKYSCTVTGITDDAKLIVKLSDGSEKNLDSGEVTLHV